ncbi:MAG TPA: MCP four helix bundle domain-containing protein, partial [Allocoleopsis sp.]
MFKNAGLQIRFFSAFMFIGLIVFAVAFLGWSTNQELSKYINILSTNSLPSVIGLWKVNEGQTQIESSERALLNVELTKTERRAEIARIQNAWNQINEGYKKYDATPRTNEEEKLYDQIKIKWAEWKKNHEKYLQMNQEFEGLGILNPKQRLLDLTIQGKKPDSPEILAAKKAKGFLDQLSQQAKDNRPSFEAATASLLQDIAYNEQFGLNAAQ